MGGRALIHIKLFIKYQWYQWNSTIIKLNIFKSELCKIESDFMINMKVSKQTVSQPDFLVIKV